MLLLASHPLCSADNRRVHCAARPVSLARAHYMAMVMSYLQTHGATNVRNYKNTKDHAPLMTYGAVLTYGRRSIHILRSASDRSIDSIVG